MKIVHVLLTSRFAGSERYMVELANAQAARHEVVVILHRRATESRPDALAHRLAPGIRLVVVSGWRFVAIWQVRRALRALAADVIHAHLSLACRSLRGFKTSALRVATLHIRYKPQQHADMDALIAIAPWQLADVPAELQPRTRQIDNWTQLRAFDHEARRQLRGELGIAEGDFLVGAMGRIEPSKGLDLLVEAYDRVRAPGVRLAVVGAGRDWAPLRRKASPEVFMPGFVPHPERWFAAFDAFVSPARSEPFGLVLLEAMANGLPVLASATDGARHLASLIGRPLVECGNLDALKNALQALISERPNRRHVDMEGHRMETKVTEVEAWYAQCLVNRVP